MTEANFPEWWQDVPAEAWFELDVRPVLQSGGEPFGLIQTTLQQLAPHQGLKLVAPFVPAPLVKMLERQGFLSFTKQYTANEIVTWFWRSTTV